MNTFKYQAITKDGTSVSGVVEANNHDEAMAKLRADYGIIDRIEEVGHPVEIDLNLSGRHADDKALSLVCNQFAIILSSGLPIARAVRLVADQTDDKTLKRILQGVADDISAGYSLADSFETHGKMLPTTFIETIRAGESSGNLEEVFRTLHTYYDKLSKTKSKVTSSLIYPLFVIGVAIVVVAIIMLYAVPMFTTTFRSMNIELPWVTKALIASSDFFTHWTWLIVVIVAALVIGGKFWNKTDRGRLFFSNLNLKLPVIGKITLMRAAAQFASTMSVMLDAGLSVITSVEVTGKAMTNFKLGEAVRSMTPDLEAGKRLGTCLGNTKAFPELLVEMASVGEETGSLEQTLSTIGDYYDNETEVKTSRALSIFEPVIIVILAVFVVMILLSVYLPLFSMYGAM